MRQLRHTVAALMHAITTIEGDHGLATDERDYMLEILYRDLADAQSQLKRLQRAA